MTAIQVLEKNIKLNKWELDLLYGELGKIENADEQREYIAKIEELQNENIQCNIAINILEKGDNYDN